MMISPKHDEWTRVEPITPTHHTTSGIYIPTRPDNDVRPGIIIPNQAHHVTHTVRTGGSNIIARRGNLPYTHRSLLNRYHLGRDVPDWWIREYKPSRYPDTIQTDTCKIKVL